MKRNWLANLALSTVALCAAACMHENPVDRGPADGAENTLPVAARTPIGSTEPVTLVRTLAELRAMRLTGNYRLANNIDASPTAGAPFTPVGDHRFPFRGTFDGNNFTIDRLTINAGGNGGLFGWAINADLKNIRLTNVNVTGSFYTGAIAGYAANVDLTNSYVTGTVAGSASGETRLGMVIGSAMSHVRVSRCYATGTVRGLAKYVGGFIGYAHATGVLTPDDDYRVRVEEVFTNVTVSPTIPASGTVYAGGLIGYLVGGSIQNINSVGAVTGRNAAGGIFGHVVNDDPNSNPTILRGAISRGVVTDAATPQRAGTIGTSTGTFAWCASYWDKTTDTGVPNPAMPEPQCQTGLDAATLKAAQLSPTRQLSPYIYGILITQDNYDDIGRPACAIGSGSDGDWGFGTCSTAQIWAANSSAEYNTLTRIPNPGVQPR